MYAYGSFISHRLKAGYLLIVHFRSSAVNISLQLITSIKCTFYKNKKTNLLIWMRLPQHDGSLKGWEGLPDVAKHHLNMHDCTDIISCTSRFKEKRWDQSNFKVERELFMHD